MTKQQRTTQILSDLDASVAWQTRNIASMDTDLADSGLSAERRRQIETARDIATRDVADHEQLAADLRSGEIDCYDDNFDSWQR